MDIINTRRLLLFATLSTFIVYSLSTFYATLPPNAVVIPNSLIPQQNNQVNLTVFVIPHSHCEVGWITDYQTYYTQNVSVILNNAFQTLKSDTTKKFVWSEMTFFKMWWSRLPFIDKDQFKSFVKNNRWEFVGAGLVQHDEALSDLELILDQLSDGLLFLQRELGGYRPTTAWQIDSFGHSFLTPKIFAELNYNYLILNHVDDRLKRDYGSIAPGSGELGKEQKFEFFWEQYQSKFDNFWQNGSGIVSHILDSGFEPPIICTQTNNTFGYNCTGFNFEKGGPDNPAVTDANVAEISNKFVQYLQVKSQWYRHSNILLPFGSYFSYQSNTNFQNFDKIISYLSKQYPKLTVKYSTVTEYFDGVIKEKDPSKRPINPWGWLPVKNDTLDWFPFTQCLETDYETYGTCSNYYSGLYSSYPSLKLDVLNFKHQIDILNQLYSWAVSYFAAQVKTEDVSTLETFVQQYDDLYSYSTALYALTHHQSITSTSSQYERNYLKQMISLSELNPNSGIDLLVKELLSTMLTGLNIDFNDKNGKDIDTSSYPDIEWMSGADKIYLFNNATSPNSYIEVPIIIWNPYTVERNEVYCAGIVMDDKTVITRLEVYNDESKQKSDVSYTSLPSGVSAQVCFNVWVEPLGYRPYYFYFNYTTSSVYTREQQVESVVEQPLQQQQQYQISNKQMTISVRFDNQTGMWRYVDVMTVKNNYTLDLMFYYYGSAGDGIYTFRPDKEGGLQRLFNYSAGSRVKVTTGSDLQKIEFLYLNSYGDSYALSIFADEESDKSSSIDISYSITSQTNKQIVLQFTDITPVNTNDGTNEEYNNDTNVGCRYYTDDGFYFIERQFRALYNETQQSAVIASNFYPSTNEFKVDYDQQTRFRLYSKRPFGVGLKQKQSRIIPQNETCSWEYMITRETSTDDGKGINEPCTNAGTVQETLRIYFGQDEDSPLPGGDGLDLFQNSLVGYAVNIPSMKRVRSISDFYKYYNLNGASFLKGGPRSPDKGSVGAWPEPLKLVSFRHVKRSDVTVLNGRQTQEDYPLYEKYQLLLRFVNTDMKNSVEFSLGGIVFNEYKYIVDELQEVSVDLTMTKERTNVGTTITMKAGEMKAFLCKVTVNNTQDKGHHLAILVIVMVILAVVVGILCCLVGFTFAGLWWRKRTESHYEMIE